MPGEDVSEAKWMNLNEFREGGYLQEVNRRFFHPLGLAMAVEMDKSDKEVVRICGLIDSREDPEGFEFAPGMIDHGYVVKLSAGRGPVLAVPVGLIRLPDERHPIARANVRPGRRVDSPADCHGLATEVVFCAGQWLH